MRITETFLKPDDGQFNPVDYTLAMIVLGSIFEELVFRGVLQNSLYQIQRLSEHILPVSIKDTRVYKLYSSTAFRIITTNFFFSISHLTNSIRSKTDMGAIRQAVRIFLYPTHSILYEKTGSLLTVSISHIAHNLFVFPITWYLRFMLAEYFFAKRG